MPSATSLLQAISRHEDEAEKLHQQYRDLQGELGTVLRERRHKTRKSLRFVARQLGISPAMLSELERGGRTWTAELVRDFLSIVT